MELIVFETAAVLAIPVAWITGFWVGMQLRTIWPAPLV